ncbi:MAG: hypothetical protein LBO63_01060 [Oscillospiraceae bacterium]|jgi:hypothetical protein|nr:hypothetical protein [Oscillospiraceae bacterium]
MSKLKRAVLRISLFLLMALLVSTMLSRTVSRLLTPSVMRVEVAANSLVDSSVPAGPCVPVSCVYEDEDGTHVYVLLERGTLMGNETFVKRVNVTELARDFEYARIEYDGAGIAEVAAYPTKALFDGEIVEVRARLGVTRR